MFDCSNVAESGYLTPSGLIWGNDDRGDGFGKLKQGINKQKRQKTKSAADARTDDTTETESEESPLAGGVITGSDEATPPEQPVVEDEDNSGNTPAPAADGSITVKPSELQALIQAEATKAAERMNGDIVAQMEAQNADYAELRRRADEQLAEVNKDLQDTRKENERLNGIFQATGTSPGSMPGGSSGDAVGHNRYKVNYNTLPLSGEPKGAASDFIDILNNSAYTPRQKFINPADGSVQESIDTRHLQLFLLQHRDHVQRDMERYAKGHGLLRGADASLAGNTSGAAGSIPDGFLPYLSAEMRLTHHAKFVWWQFANFGIQLGQQPGQTVLVPKFELLDDATSEADFTLDTATSSANISTDNQALIANTVPVEIKGYGLGLGNNVNTRPVAIPEFIMATSMLELVTALNTNLTHNYNSFEDLLIRTYYREALYRAENIWYNNQSEVTNDSTAIVAGADGTMTEEFATNLSAQMDDDDIPALEDGCRIGVLATKAAAQFKLSLGDKIQVPTEAQLEEMTNILIHSYPGATIDRPVQYMGKYCGFHMYQNMSSSKGNTGREGVYAGDALPSGAGALDAAPPNVTAIGTAAPADSVLRDSYFFGPGAVGKGSSMPMELRQDDANQFGTKMRFIWRSIEGYASIDVSSLNNAGTARTQQDRVYVARTSDRVI